LYNGADNVNLLDPFENKAEAKLKSGGKKLAIAKTDEE